MRLFCKVKMESTLGFASVMVQYNFLSDFADKIKRAAVFVPSPLCINTFKLKFFHTVTPSLVTSWNKTLCHNIHLTTHQSTHNALSVI